MKTKNDLFFMNVCAFFPRAFSVREKRLLKREKPISYSQYEKHEKLAEKSLGNFPKKNPLSGDITEFKVTGKGIGQGILDAVKSQGFKGKEALGIMHSLLAQFSAHMYTTDKKGFDINYIPKGCTFEIKGNEAILRNKKGAKKSQEVIPLYGNATHEISHEAYKNWGALDAEISESNLVSMAELEKQVKKKNLTNVRMLLGLKTSLKYRRDDWEKEGGGIEGSSFISPLEWVKQNYSGEKLARLLNEDGSQSRTGKKGYVGSVGQNIALAKYYLAAKKGEVEAGSSPQKETVNAANNVAHEDTPAAEVKRTELEQAGAMVALEISEQPEKIVSREEFETLLPQLIEDNKAKVRKVVDKWQGKAAGKSSQVADDLIGAMGFTFSSDQERKNFGGALQDTMRRAGVNNVDSDSLIANGGIDNLDQYLQPLEKKEDAKKGIVTYRISSEKTIEVKEKYKDALDNIKAAGVNLSTLIPGRVSRRRLCRVKARRFCLVQFEKTELKTFLFLTATI